MVIFPDVQVLDAAGPLEVFSLANRLARGPRYELSVLAPEAGPVMTSSGLPIVAGRSIRQASGPVDTLIVAGGLGSGAFLLGEAGLLDGRRATTHWAVCDALQRRYPGARVEGDPIFVRDGKISTSAGVTAGMDLALELVEEDGGRDLALSVARWLVMFLRRPGGQSQFSVQLRSQVAERRGLRDLQS